MISMCEHCNENKKITKKKGSNYVNLVGQTFSRLLVLEEYGRDKEGRTLWKCQCSCGNIKIVSTKHLRNGSVQSCGCLMKERVSESNKKNIKGNVYGRLTVEKEAGVNKCGHILWECSCTCGGSIVTTGRNLRLGYTRSCGCLERESKSRRKLVPTVNKRFGKLFVLKRVFPKKNSEHAFYKCRCDCGSIVIVDGTALRNGNTKSCGCLKSKGELKVGEILRDNKIKFEKQKIYNDLIGRKHGVLKFDFYVIDGNYLIEYDGKQHFEKGGYINEEKFNIIKENDNKKNDYCKGKGIPLIRIPYTHLNDICLEDLLLETTKYRII